MTLREKLERLVRITERGTEMSRAGEFAEACTLYAERDQLIDEIVEQHDCDDSTERV